MRFEEIISCMALSMAPGIGPVKARALMAHCGSAEAVFTEKKKHLQRIPDIGPFSVKAILHQAPFEKAKSEFAFAEKNNIRIVTLNDDGYPHRLKHCPDGPIVLFCRGNAPLNAPYAISIVGTRKATAYGRKCCEDLLQGIAHLKPLVISGLAYGIDIAAHKTALELNLPTVACLAHGLDRIYPPPHTAIARQMTEHGALVTEFPSGTQPDRELFPSRNRIIAGMADCTVVVETDRKGGSIITAHCANSYNREVFAVPGRCTDLHSSGCNELIRKNLAAILSSPQELVEYMQWNPTTQQPQPTLFSELEPQERDLLQFIPRSRSRDIDGICADSGWPQSLVAAVLLQLEFKGIVQALPGKTFSRKQP
jgi:DNA processing protein